MENGWPVLIKYACGHERTSTTTFFVGVPRDTDRRTVIGVAFGDSDEDVFIPAPVIIDKGDHISSDGRDWKPYFFRDARGELIFRIAPIRLDLELVQFASAHAALAAVGYPVPIGGGG